MDEPTTGVDAVSRKEFWEMLKRLKEQNITILVSTPYMDEATLCDRIALMQSGKILSIDTPENIVKAYPGKLYAVTDKNMYKLLIDLRAYNETLSCFAFGDSLHFSLKNDNAETEAKTVKYLKEKGHENSELKQITPGIEDCFIKLMS